MEHDLDLLILIWKELKPHLIVSDADAAADDFIHVLLEHGVDANELLTYALDRELKLALRGVADEENFEDEEEDDDYFYDEDDEDGY